MNSKNCYFQEQNRVYDSLELISTLFFTKRAGNGGNGEFTLKPQIMQYWCLHGYMIRV